MMEKVTGRLRSCGPATHFGKTDIGLGNTPIDYYLMPEQSIWTMQGFSIGTAQCVLLPEPTVDYYIELYVGFTRLL